MILMLIKKINLAIHEFHFLQTQTPPINGVTLKATPEGFVVKTKEHFESGSLVKMHLSIPSYWERKQKFVSYDRIDTPEYLKIIGRIVGHFETGKRVKHYQYTIQLLIADEADRDVLRAYLTNG